MVLMVLWFGMSAILVNTDMSRVHSTEIVIIVEDGSRVVDHLGLALLGNGWDIQLMKLVMIWIVWIMMR